MRLPRVTIGPFDDGWTATCHSCGWRLWHIRRPVADLEALEHQPTCSGIPTRALRAHRLLGC